MNFKVTQFSILKIKVPFPKIAARLTYNGLNLAYNLRGLLVTGLIFGSSPQLIMGSSPQFKILRLIFVFSPNVACTYKHPHMCSTLVWKMLRYRPKGLLTMFSSPQPEGPRDWTIGIEFIVCGFHWIILAVCTRCRVVQLTPR